MEYFLWTCAQYNVLQKYKRFLQIPVDELMRRDDMFDNILSDCVSRFVGWVLYHVAAVGTQGRSQLFYITFVNQFFGLSRDGIDCNNMFGFGISLRMFDSCRKQHEQLAAQRISEKVSVPHVSWWDNFSKFHRHNVPTLLRPVFASCLWTGCTINEYVGPSVSMQLVPDNAGGVTAAMPDNLFECKESVDSGIALILGEGFNAFQDSLVNRYHVNNVPLKIDESKYDELKTLLGSDKNSTRHIHPQKLIQQNIGSTRGLLVMLRDLQEREMMHIPNGCDKYHVLNFDENIYYRVLKVCMILYIVACYVS